MQDVSVLKKISGPVLSPTILHRDRLVRKLEEIITGKKNSGGYKLVVLCAPAGYGKTTLLADFAQHSNFPCCWYSLERTDADEETFLTVLLQSIRTLFPHFGKALDPLSANALAAGMPHQPDQLEAVIDALITALASEITERFALFLCNFHEVNTSQRVSDTVNRLLQRLPPQCIFVIESRAVPTIDFASLLARDEIVGIDHTLLRFTAAELRDLACIQEVAPLKETEAEQLNTLFGGWIAGILLGTRLGDARILRSCRDVYTSASAPDLQIDRHNLYGYLVKEVFGHDKETLAFLKETSVLQQMTPALCDALLETTDAAGRLQYLEQHGLFVTRGGDDPQITYTCHPLLRELFHEELHSQSPKRFAALHARAMKLQHASRNYEQAIYHALEASLNDAAVGLIFEVHEQMLELGRVETLARWIDALPTEITTRYPKLLLIRARTYLLSGEYALALPLLALASEAIMRQPPVVDANEIPLLQASIAIAQSKALFQMGEYAQAQQLCQQIIEQVPANETILHAEAHTRLGMCANVQGNFAVGIVHLQKALQLWGRNSERRQTAELHSALASAYSLIGNFALAEHHHSRATRCWDRLQDERGKVDSLTRLALIKFRQGELAEAEALLQQALTIARSNVGFRRGAAYALVNLGEIYQDQGLYDRSLAVTEDGLALARQLQDRYLISCALCILAMTYLLMGDAETALFLVSEVKLEPSSGRNDGYERAICELTRGTIFLYQGRHDEAFALLTDLESYLRKIGLKADLLRTTLRLIECQLTRGAIPEALQHIDEMAALILHNDYEQLVRRELRLLPTLERAVRTMPELARLRAIIQPETAPAPAEIAEEQRPAPVALTPELAITGQRHLKILALGEPAIFIDEKQVTRWRMGRAMELAFLLLDNGGPLRKEQIIEALWPETDERIDQTFHSTIHFLRKSLGSSCIASHAATYWLDLPSLYRDAVWYDVAAFQEHNAKARQALLCNDDITAKTELLAMIALYRGDYVQSFYSDWCTFKRSKLRLAYLDARHQLALIAWRAEQIDESVIHWQHALAIDDCLETAHYGLMRCYLRQGKRGLALRQYQHCVEVLRRELSAEPGTAIQGLYQQIMKSSSARPAK